MSLSALTKGFIRLAVQQLEHAQAVVPNIKGVGNFPYHSRIGLIKIITVGGGSIVCGGVLAHLGALYLQHSGYFDYKEDDDDDDD